MVVLSIAFVSLAQAGDRANDPQSDLPPDLVVPAAPALSAEDEAKTFRIQKGYEVKLVASEPLVVDPVQITFDETGRLWVVEMRGYMPDEDGKGEYEPIGVIAVLSDEDGDGVMDTREEFAKDLVLPRGVVPMAGGALCMLPPDLVFLRDDDGDGTFDTREVVATGLRRGLDNPEHAVNSPTHSIDNWIHFANWDRQVRRVFDEDGTPRWITRRERGGGQWGLSVDEFGRAYRNTNPNPLYIDLVPSTFGVRNKHQRGFRGPFANVDAKHAVFPSRINPGVNRGYQANTLRDDFTLRQFTGACAPTVLMGDGLGSDARGDVFVAEPCGNLVKRYAMTEAEGALAPVAKSVHDKNDFLTSTDERFRPVAMTTAPDGSLFVADMYRGIIQHRIFMTTFLRKQVVARGLSTPLGQGRIWRVVKTGATAEAPDVDLLALGLVELVPHLGSPNAWLRLSAQRLIVEDFDGESSVVAALRELAQAADDSVGARHALWALDGIGFSTPEVVGSALRSEDAHLRAAAVQIAEALCDVEGNELFGVVAKAAVHESHDRVRLLALLALGASPRDGVLAHMEARMTASAESSYERSAVVSGLEYREAAFVSRLAVNEAWKSAAPGRASLLKELAACVGREGLPESIEALVDTALDPPAEWWSKPLLDGLFQARKKGPKGEILPIPLRAMPASFIPTPDSSPIVQSVDEGCTWPGKPGAVEIEVPRDLTADELLQYEHGARVYAATCATCHQTHGGGQDGKAPTLRGTQYAVGSDVRLVRILMHGLEGPLVIDGTTWNMEMPRFEGNDEDLAAVLTYVRRTWGNGADPVTQGRVEELRARSGGRVKPMTAKELR